MKRLFLLAVIVSAQAQAQTPAPHAGHQAEEPHTTHAAPPVQPPVSPPPEASSGPRHAADAIFGSAQMDVAREQFRREHGAIFSHKILINQLETAIRGGRDGYAWDTEAWYGGDIDRLWIKTEGDGEFGANPDQVEVQALWSHAIDPWFNLQAGVRHDFRPDPERTHLVLGVEGLAPYWFEIDGALFVSDKGDVTARLETSYDLRLTQRLILQPDLEANLSAQTIRAFGVGSGLTSVEAGLRLRYQVSPRFAPYVGARYERRLGKSADFARSAGEDVGGWSFLLGLRSWF